ncbi:MAG: phytanoyl-CoA dioxygenase family protein [Chloroflexi bacterium]|nr:phytanoyl-CoA dioxygenase family protein [Chloroflexota bacterium]MCY3937135.1 phytanoyl-CoA dioxygenase family protein [Chloroflexota bacterium]
MVVTETEVQSGTELLTARQMAQFAIDGFLEFDDIVPQDLVEAVYEDELKTVDENGLNERFRWHITDNPHGFYEFSEATREVQNLPAVKAVLRSLLGPGYQANHSALHATPPLHKEAQKWHVDAGGKRQVRLPKIEQYSFDVLTAFFAHDTPDEMGPTLILPGSHMRWVLGPDIGRYKNIVGQRKLSGKAGRMIFFHEGLWHCAQPNATEQWRFMFKVRYNPRVRQRGLFNTEGWDSPEIRRFFRVNKRTHDLSGEADAVGWTRADWWRYLCGADEMVDPSGTLSHGDYA